MHKYLVFLLLTILLSACSATKVVNNDELLTQSQTYLRQGLYAQAIEGFIKLKDNKTYHRQAVKGIIEAYTQQGQKKELIELLERDYQMNPRPFLISALAALHRDAGDIAASLRYYKEYERGLLLDSKNSQTVKGIIAQLEEAQRLLDNPYNVDIAKLDYPINTELSEYSPSFNLDESTLIFTRQINGQEDLYQATKLGEKYDVSPISQINTRYNEGAQTIAGDGSRLIFTHCNERFGYGSCDLYQSLRQQNTWSEPKNLGPSLNTAGWESHPSLSEDGRTLYYATNRPGGFGGSDIWTTTLQDDQTWSQPSNLGPIVNTPGNERSPYIHADGTTLYYSSDGLGGIGGKDLYMTQKEATQWSFPKNLGAPINTPFDDNNLVVSTDGTYGYYSREDTLGQQRDLYRISIPVDLRPIPVTFLRYLILDSRTQDPLMARLSIIDLDQNKEIKTLMSNKKGVILSTVPLGKNLSLHAISEGFLFHSEHVFYPSFSHGQKPFIDTLYLQPLINKEQDSNENKKPIVLKNIFFDSGSATLKQESQGEIDLLANLMREHESIEIILTGHTDNVGDAQDNMALSLKRSQAVRQALIDSGIISGRIDAQGRGESEPIADNETPEGRATNRRTELIVKN